MTEAVNYEVICVDNNSRLLTRMLLVFLHWMKWIDKLHILNHNSLFAGGNNIAARLAADDSEYFLLLNSDVQILSADWLARLLSEHKSGATSYGVVRSKNIPRLDGYCFLIDRELYEKYKLDEDRFQWTWAVTRLQAELLSAGKCVRGFADHSKYLVHFGGKSGKKGFAKAKGIDTDKNEVNTWFGGKFPDIEGKL
jgi:hypothetical protein